MTHLSVISTKLIKKTVPREFNSNSTEKYHEKSAKTIHDKSTRIPQENTIKFHGKAATEYHDYITKNPLILREKVPREIHIREIHKIIPREIHE